MFEQTDHSDISEDHYTGDLAEVHECNAVLSDGHNQLDMQRQGITVLHTVIYLLKMNRKKNTNHTECY